jgi:hypothetical protein
VFAQPQVVIQAARTEPETIRPGSPFTLFFQVVNQGDYTAGNVRVSLGPTTLVVPREGGSLLVAGQITADQTVDLSLPLALSSAAPAGYQSLELIVEYYDYLGQPYKSSQNVGISVSNNTTQPLVPSATPRSRRSSRPVMFSLNLRSPMREERRRSVLVTWGGTAAV